MKKTLSVLLSVLMLMSITAGLDFSAYAASYSGKCGDNTKYSFNTNTGTFTISGTGDMGSYDQWMDYPWDSYRESIKRVVVKKGVTSISRYAFYECHNLTSVSLADTIKLIDYGVFMDCSALGEVKLPASLEMLGGGTFWNCPIKSITLPEGLKRICEADFSKTNLTTVKIPASVVNIGTRVFEKCKSLESIYVYNKSMYFYPSLETIEEDVKLYGYANSTAHEYAKAYGRRFVDIKTKKETKYKVTNNDLIALLPTDLKCTEPVCNNTTVSDEGVYIGCQPKIYHEENKNSKKYKKLKAKVDEIIAGKKTTYDKAEAIVKWVRNNMTYRFWGFPGDTIDAVYDVFEYREGNCMSHTLLANYMLYIAGIPTADIVNRDHNYSAVLIDGKWYCADATGGRISEGFGDYYDITKISFTTPDFLTMVIENNSGIALAGIKINFNYDTPEVINLPSYVNDIYPYYMVDSYTGKVTVKTIKGTVGSGAEKWCREQKLCITESGKAFTARQEHSLTGKSVKKATPSANGAVMKKCSCCNKQITTSVIYQPKTITLSKSAYTYNGKAKKPAVTVKDSKGNIISSKNYTVKYSNNKSVGTATITVTFKNNYSGTLKKTFTIKPKNTSISGISSGKKKLTIKVNKCADDVNGYQLQYSTSSKFINAKTVSVNNKTTSKTIKGLEANQTYYVRIRTYKTVNSTKYYSSWSKTKSVTAK